MLKAIFRRIAWVLTLGAYKIDEGTNQSMVASSAAVKAAYNQDIQYLTGEFGKIKDGISGVEVAIEEKTERLRKLNEEEKRLLQLQKGAAIKVKKARAEGNQDEEARFTERFKELGRAIAEKEELQEELAKSIETSKESLKGHYTLARKLEREIQKLKTDKHEVAADVEANKRIVAMQEQLSGIGVGTYERKSDIVMRENRKLTAQRNVVGKLAGESAMLEDEELLKELSDLGTDDELEDMIASFDASKPTGIEKNEVNESSDPGRPSI